MTEPGLAPLMELMLVATKEPKKAFLWVTMKVSKTVSMTAKSWDEEWGATRADLRAADSAQK